jgi:voltage-gated potassium channel
LRARACRALAPEADGLGRGLNVSIAVLIVLNVIAVSLETVESIHTRHASAFRAFEMFSVGVFALEYMLRLWTCTNDPSRIARMRDRLHYVLTPMALIDLAAILPAFLPGNSLDLRFVRSVRLLRLTRSLKLARHSTALRTLTIVVRSKRDELAVTLFLAVILLICASGGIYFAEREAQPDVFSSIPAAMWWAITTLTTVGYGDAYPVTIGGKVFGSLVAVTGVGLFALPTGILAGGFSEEMARRRKGARVCPNCGMPIAS